MNYDIWKTTDPRDSEPDYDARQELDDYDRADLLDDYDGRDRGPLDDADLLPKVDPDVESEISFWQGVNQLAIEYPEFSIVVIPEADDDVSI